jgi:3-deoxy-D-manno-octulosonate 8-phosphate phosphatase (KDO 8-P phosphatase)
MEGKLIPASKPTVFILDVDGVLTTGQFLYTSEGKAMKVFGPDDNDGLSLLKPYLEVRFVTGDKKGLAISRKRVVEDMKYELDVVSTIRRVEWIAERYPLESVIYMGDGIFDHYVMQKVGYSIAPANSDKNAKLYANYVTERAGGDRAVAEAALHILEKFFQPFDPAALPNTKSKLSGEWAV